MLRAGVLVAVVLTLAVIAGSTATPAHAFYGPNPAQTWGTLQPVLLSPGADEAASGSLTTEAKTRAYAARAAVGTRPTLAQLAARVTYAGTALYVGYKLGGTINRWLKISTMLTGIDSATTPGSGGNVCLGGTASFGGYNPPGTFSNDGYPGVNYSTDGMLSPKCNGGNATVWSPEYQASNAFRDTLDSICATIASCFYSDKTGLTNRAYFITHSTYEGSIEIKGDESYGAQAFDFTAPSGEATDAATAQTALASMGSGDSAAIAATAAIQAGGPDVDFEIGQYLDPTWEGETAPTFTVPDCDGYTYAGCVALYEAAGALGTITEVEASIDEADLAAGAGNVIGQTYAVGTVQSTEVDVDLTVNPDVLPLEAQLALTVNETAVEYVTRLEALGFTGTVTYVDLTETAGDPALGPSAAVTVRAPALGKTWDPAYALPSPTPRIWPDTNLTIDRNPSTYPEAAEAPIPLAGGGTGGCEPWLETSFDLSPLLDLELGETFPFGVPVWLVDQADALVASPDAPSWSINVPSVDADWEMDLNPFDPYMSTMRTVLSWLLWLGTIWYVGATVLGFRGTGNPADAVDDYLDGIVP